MRALLLQAAGFIRDVNGQESELVRRLLLPVTKEPASFSAVFLSPSPGSSPDPAAGTALPGKKDEGELRGRGRIAEHDPPGQGNRCPGAGLDMACL